METKAGSEEGGNLILSLIYDLVILQENDTVNINAFLGRCEMILRNLKLNRPHYTAILNAGLSANVRFALDRSFSEAKRQVHSILLNVYEEYELFGKDRVAKARSQAGRSNRIFLVHGHDKEMLSNVRGILGQLGLEPIVLLEQPDRGRSIMEKIEEYSDVGFAIIIMSPDDEGRDRHGPQGLKPRARQNVILELGFFNGKLGRHKTHVIYRKEDDFEFPSDYQGILYTEYDEHGGWRSELIMELQAAGYNVDANRLTKK